MDNENFSSNIINKIQSDHLVPKPSWEFKVKSYLLWTLLVIVTLFGSLAVATIIFMITDYDWDVFEYLDRGLIEHIFIAIPYLWLLILIFFIVLARYVFRETKRGYKFEIYKIISVSLLGSILIGGCFYALGIDSEIHEFFAYRVPFYEKLVQTKNDIWIYPDQGLLSGIVLVNNKDASFVLRDFRGNEWLIQRNDDTEYQGNIRVGPGEELKLIGKKTSDGVFSTQIIRSWYNR